MRAVMHSSNSVNNSRRVQGLMTAARSSGVLSSAWAQSAATSSNLLALALPLVPTSPPPAGAGPRVGTWSPKRGISRCKACQELSKTCTVESAGAVCNKSCTVRADLGKRTICVFFILLSLLLLLLLLLFTNILMASAALEATCKSHDSRSA
jgi:hypothetical protein